MTSPPKRHPGVPRFDEALLDRIAAALGRRAKAIKYYADQFACTRETEANGQERLNVDVQELGVQIRLSVWADGAMWLGVHELGPRREGGWNLAYRGYGNVADLDAGVVIEMFEETSSTACGRTCPPDVYDQIEHVWRGADLEREQQVG